ncbi:ATP-binding protein [Amycolatopsis palatopharyngis]|uniref:ATP-binding protein n=1 Tax=Amycolatopsis palatopharyngis TaxID=187982 RepID=UPI0013BE8E53|nr:ATP-binding protein [Amycolatopsis palatopharyngis]
MAETLRKWSATFIEPDMEAVAGELVAFSVKQTGPADVVSYRDITEPHLFRLRLLGYQRHITFEVIDEHDEALVFPEDAELPEGSGLALVDARAGRWGSHLTQHGRVMWAELGVYEQSAVGLPRRPVKPTPSPRSSPEPAPQEFDLLRRVRAGLENMYPSR